MDFLKKLVLIILVLGTAFYVKTNFFPTTQTKVPTEEITQNEEVQNPDEKQQEIQKPSESVIIYFIGQNSNKDEVYKLVKRNFDPSKDGTKLDFALNELLKGPNYKEKNMGIYTEIPTDTKIRSISKINGKLYIDLSYDFEQGGGTDGLYKRLYQLIKTVNKNSSENVYLKIEGREVDVIGGEGIMINQPLTPHSLDS